MPPHIPNLPEKPIGVFSPDKPGHPFYTRTSYNRPYYPYPECYNPMIHGAYDPARNYTGVPREPMKDVKLGNMKTWLATRNYGFRHNAQTVFRMISRFHASFIRSKYTPILPFGVLYLWYFGFRFAATTGWQPGSHGGPRYQSERKYH